MTFIDYKYPENWEKDGWTMDSTMEANDA